MVVLFYEVLLALVFRFVVWVLTGNVLALSLAKTAV
jgi:hypothetical protein